MLLNILIKSQKTSISLSIKVDQLLLVNLLQKREIISISI